MRIIQTTIFIILATSMSLFANVFDMVVDVSGNGDYSSVQSAFSVRKNLQYNYNCYVEGVTDFIYGDATTVFDNCTLNCVKGGQYISAPSATKLVTQFISGNVSYHGLMIISSDVTTNDDVVSNNSYYLKRSWQPWASSLFIYCSLGYHIKPHGWSTGNDDNHLSGFYGEYQNTDFDGNAIDVSQRVEWSSPIAYVRLQNVYKYSFFVKKSGEKWNAEKVAKLLLTPENVHLDGNTISWNEVEDALGYVVYKSGSFFATSCHTSIEAPGVNASVITVKSVRDNGVEQCGKFKFTRFCKRLQKL